MKIRVANNSDMQAIVDLHIESWRENYHEVLSAKFLRKEIEQERFNLWQARFSAPESNHLILIADDNNGDFCGFICAFGNNDSIYVTLIDNLHIKPELKGRGIGGKLLKAVANWANEYYGEYGLYLEVLKINTKAEAFYQSKGAKKMAAKVWQTPCGNTADEFIYGWSAPVEYLNLNP